MQDATDHPKDDGTAAGNPADGGRLSPAEELKKVVDAGRPVCRGGGKAAAQGRSWGEERELPAHLLYELLASPESTAKPRAAILDGLKITGPLNLEAAELQAPLIAHNCYFEEPVNLTAAKAPEIRLTDCVVRALAADRLETRGDLDLSKSTLGVLGLLGAHIGGVLLLVGTVLNGGRYPIDLGDGGLSPPESPPESPIDEVPERVALVADGLRVDHSMSFHDGVAQEEVRLPGAHIGGQLSFKGATLTTSSRWALYADGLQVDQSMRCDQVSADGELRLLGAHIGGQLNLESTKPANNGGWTLSADRLRVDQDMVCRGISARGLSLLGAHIGGQLNFDGAQVDAGDAPHERPPAAMRLPEPSGRRDPRSAEQPRPAVLNADGLEVNQSMFCRCGFTAKGELSLLGAHIGGQLSFDGAKLANEGGRALSAASLRVDHDVLLRFAEPPSGEVDLTGARLGWLFDRERTWPMLLRVRGCVYEGVEAADDARGVEAADDAPEQQATRQEEGKARYRAWLRRLRPGAPPDVHLRLKWLRLVEEGQRDERSWLRRRWQRVLCLSERVVTTVRCLLGRQKLPTAASSASGAGYAPQPYTQLMRFYRQEGRDGDVRRVAFERERRRRGQLGLPGKLWNLFLRFTVGYGYKPLRTLMWLGLLVFVGAFVFSSFYSPCGETPPKDCDLKPVKEDHPEFVASIYTFDRLIPVVSFGLRDGFVPHEAAQWWAFAYTLLGWALTVAIVAGLNAAIRRD